MWGKEGAQQDGLRGRGASSTCDALSVLRSINNIGWADGYEYERS